MATPVEVVRQLASEVRDLQQGVSQLFVRLDAIEAERAQWDEPLVMIPGNAGEEAAGSGEPVGSTPSASVPEDQGVVIAYHGGDSEITIPPPDKAQRSIRERLLPQIAFEHLPKQHMLAKDQAEEAYLQGGPYWLYCFDRDYVVSLPDAVRKVMVVDLEHTSADLAREVARDILKDPEPGTPELTIGNLQREVDFDA